MNYKKIPQKKIHSLKKTVCFSTGTSMYQEYFPWMLFSLTNTLATMSVIYYDIYTYQTIHFYDKLKPLTSIQYLPQQLVEPGCTGGQDSAMMVVTAQLHG